MNYQKAKSIFDADGIRELSQSPEGLRYLKLRSQSRKSHLEHLFSLAEVTPVSTSARDLLKEAYECSTIDTKTIEQSINQLYNKDRQLRSASESDLIDQLYRLDSFDWGGLHQNSLEKTIVDNYVKKIQSYDHLSECIENELHHSMRGYVLCSWFNHWTSIVIEDIFRDHPAVLPAVGQIKKVDFFVNDTPFDLKVTYFPEGYIKVKRRDQKLRPELTLLKQWARKHEVPFSTDLPDGRLLSDLWAKLHDHPNPTASGLLTDIKAFRESLIANTIKDPGDLIRWLYENQGVRRFDASNRLFLILIDQRDFFQSWKLKRAKPLLEEHIKTYLDGATNNPWSSHDFNWEGSTYSAVAGAIVVVKHDH